MGSDRYEIRLDSEHRRKLSELAAVRDAPASEVVREIIDEAYEDIIRVERVKAAGELAAMAVEDVPDPETVSRQLESAHDPGVP